MRYRSVLATREIRVAVTADVSPVGDVVQFAFTNPNAQPVSGDWISGAWKTDQLPTREWVAYITVGPRGDIALPVGEYAVWISVTDSTTEPVEPVDVLTITGTDPSTVPTYPRSSPWAMDLLDIL